MGSRDDEFKISLFLNHFYNLKKIPLKHHWCIAFGVSSLCAGRRLSSHNNTETFGSHCTIIIIIINIFVSAMDRATEALRYVTIDDMLWLTYKITYCVFLRSIMYFVLVSFVTIATTGAIFSLQFTKNRLAAGLRPDPLGKRKGDVPLTQIPGSTPGHWLCSPLLCPTKFPRTSNGFWWIVG